MLLVKLSVLVLLQFCGGGGTEPLPSGARVPHVEPHIRIIDGHEAVPHEAPYMVYIQVVMNGSMAFCGGTLIDKQFVLTAGHCLRGSKTRVYRVDLGVHDLWDPFDRQEYEASSFAVHDQFVQDVASHDIAVIRLERPAALTPGKVEAANLPPAAAFPAAQEAFAGREAVIYGWGRTQQEPALVPNLLQKLEVKVVPYSECGGMGGASKDALCVGRRDGRGGTTCFGDSGGPLVTGGGLVVGVDSRLSSWSCRDSPVALYARVDYHMDWIRRQMAELK